MNKEAPYAQLHWLLQETDKGLEEVLIDKSCEIRLV